jgi:hypothetical protein
VIKQYSSESAEALEFVAERTFEEIAKEEQASSNLRIFDDSVSLTFLLQKLLFKF